MTITNKDFLYFLKNSFLGGAFSLLAYFCFSASSYYSQDEISVLSRALKSNTFNFWVEHHFSNVQVALNSMLMFSVLLLLCFLGLMCATFSVVTLDNIKKFLSENMGNNKVSMSRQGQKKVKRR